MESQPQQLRPSPAMSTVNAVFEMWLPILFLWLPLSLFLEHCLVHTWHKVFSRHGLPRSIPWGAGSKEGFLARGRLTLQSFFGMREIVEAAQEKYTSKDQLYVLPNLVFGPEVILPLSQARWLLDQPESVISHFEVSRDAISADKTFLHKKVVFDTIHKRVIEKEMSKNQDSYAEAMAEEVDFALRINWGNDTNEWREIPTFVTLNDVIPRVTSRVLVGLPLCRNEEFVNATAKWGTDIPLIAILDHLLPPVLRPVLIPLANMYDNMLFRRIKKHMYPIVEERVKLYERAFNGKTAGEVKFEQPHPNDYVEWALNYAFTQDRSEPVEREPDVITRRLIVLNFASMHATIVTITNLLFDIASHPQSLLLQKMLREEVLLVQAKYSGEEWSRASLAEMVKLDSAIRESMRLWGFSTRGVSKQVMAPNGVDLPSGEHLPCGVKLGITNWGPHHDGSIYGNPYDFEPLRFYEGDIPAEVETFNPGTRSHAPKKGLSMTITQDYFMGFSHGRHACPGRWFAQHHVKTEIAQMLLNYDIEPTSERFQNIWLNNLMAPPLKTTLRVRRRQQ